jgi:pyruvate dehydrogenase E1 component alpha subunit
LTHHLLAAGAVTQAQVDALNTALRAEIADAIRFAEQSPFPRPETALEDLFV